MDPNLNPTGYILSSSLVSPAPEFDNVAPSPRDFSIPQILNLKRVHETKSVTKSRLQHYSRNFLTTLLCNWRPNPSDMQPWYTLPADGYLPPIPQPNYSEPDCLPYILDTLKNGLFATIERLVENVALYDPQMPTGKFALIPNQHAGSDLGCPDHIAGIGSVANFLWCTGHPGSQDHSGNLGRMAVIVLGPWAVRRGDLDEFCAPKARGVSTSLESPSIFTDMRAALLWSHINTLCLKQDVRRWVVTTYEFSIFGMSTPYLTSYSHSKPLRWNSDSPSILSLMLYWTLATIQMPPPERETVPTARQEWLDYYKFATTGKRVRTEDDLLPPLLHGATRTNLPKHAGGHWSRKRPRRLSTGQERLPVAAKSPRMFEPVDTVMHEARRALDAHVPKVFSSAQSASGSLAVTSTLNRPASPTKGKEVSDTVSNLLGQYFAVIEPDSQLASATVDSLPDASNGQTAQRRHSVSLATLMPSTHPVLAPPGSVNNVASPAPVRSEEKVQNWSANLGNAIDPSNVNAFIPGTPSSLGEPSPAASASTPHNPFASMDDNELRDMSKVSYIETLPRAQARMLDGRFELARLAPEPIYEMGIARCGFAMRRFAAEPQHTIVQELSINAQLGPLPEHEAIEVIREHAQKLGALVGDDLVFGGPFQFAGDRHQLARVSEPGSLAPRFVEKDAIYGYEYSLHVMKDTTSTPGPIDSGTPPESKDYGEERLDRDFAKEVRRKQSLYAAQNTESSLAPEPAVANLPLALPDIPQPPLVSSDPDTISPFHRPSFESTDEVLKIADDFIQNPFDFVVQNEVPPPTWLSVDLPLSSLPALDTSPTTASSSSIPTAGLIVDDAWSQMFGVDLNPDEPVQKAVVTESLHPGPGVVQSPSRPPKLHEYLGVPSAEGKTFEEHLESIFGPPPPRTPSPRVAPVLLPPRTPTKPLKENKIPSTSLAPPKKLNLKPDPSPKQVTSSSFKQPRYTWGPTRKVGVIGLRKLIIRPGLEEKAPNLPK